MWVTVTSTSHGVIVGHPGLEVASMCVLVAYLS